MPPVMMEKLYNVRRWRQVVAVGLISLAGGCAVPAQNTPPPIVVTAPAAVQPGWYLIAPPLIKGGDDAWVADSYAPLGKWRIMSSYQNVTDCQKQADFGEQLAKSQSARFRQFSSNWVIFERLMLERCIASNDPGLAQ